MASVLARTCGTAAASAVAACRGGCVAALHNGVGVGVSGGGGVGGGAAYRGCARALASAAASQQLYASPPRHAYASAQWRQCARALLSPLAPAGERAFSVTATAAATVAADFPPHLKLNMPALSPTMKQGNLVNWTKQVGDEVAPGDVLAEIETDKATVEFEAQDEGYLAKVFVPAGTQDVPVGKLVAVLAENKDDIGAFEQYEAPATMDAAADDGGKSGGGGGGGRGDDDVDTARDAETTTPAASEQSGAAAMTSRSDAERDAKAQQPQRQPQPQQGAQSHAQSSPAAPAARHDGRVFASPLARSLASEAALDLAALTGTGPKGRVIAADVNEALERADGEHFAAASESSSTASASPAAMAQAQQQAAELFAESKRTVPHYQLVTECRLERAIDFVTQCNERNAEQIDAGKQAPLELTDLFVKAVAAAARRVPEVNASWMNASIRQYDSVDVAIQNEHGVLAPVVHGACRKGMERIAQDRLNSTPLTGGDDARGGTVTITTSDEVQQYVAIVRPPQAAVIAFGRPERRLVPAPAPRSTGAATGDDGGAADGDMVMSDGSVRAAGVDVEVATVTCATASFDHRVVDGAIGAQFIAHFRRCVEEPLSMLL